MNMEVHEDETRALREVGDARVVGGLVSGDDERADLALLGRLARRGRHRASCQRGRDAAPVRRARQDVDARPLAELERGRRGRRPRRPWSWSSPDQTTATRLASRRRRARSRSSSGGSSRKRSAQTEGARPGGTDDRAGRVHRHDTRRRRAAPPGARGRRRARARRPARPRGRGRPRRRGSPRAARGRRRARDRGRRAGSQRRARALPRTSGASARGLLDGLAARERDDDRPAAPRPSPLAASSTALLPARPVEAAAPHADERLANPVGGAQWSNVKRPLSQSQPSSTSGWFRERSRVTFPSRVVAQTLQPTGQSPQTVGTLSISHGRARKR